MILKNKKPFSPNRPQLLAMMHNAKVNVNMWGRGTGKTTFYAWVMQKVAHEMPRSNWVIVGRTFGQLQTIVVPEIIRALERLGYYKDVHFTVGSLKGSRMGFPDAMRMPLKPEYFFHWYTGTGFNLISQDREGAGRGYNIHGILADEGLTLIADRFRKEIVAANRGDEEVKDWKKTLLHSVHISSSKPTGSSGNWLLELGDYYDKEELDYDLVNRKIADLQYRFVASNDEAERAHLWNQIIALKRKIKYFIHKDKDDKDFQHVYYNEANVFDNIKFLGISYLEQQMRILTRLEFLVEILNVTIKEVPDGFYSAFDELKHTYEQFNESYLELMGWDFLDQDKKHTFNDSRKDGDVNPDAPLDIGGDYGYYLNCLTVSQEHRSDEKWEYRYLNAFWRKPDYLIDKVTQDFCDYYRFHKSDVVNYFYDKTAISKEGRDLSYKDMVVKVLRDNKWHVNEYYMGNVPNPEARYNLWSKALTGDDRLPVPMFNRKNCKYLTLAMQLAGVKQGRKGFEKDKRPERNPDIPQEETPHLTDAADQAFFHRFQGNLKEQGEFMDNWYGGGQ